MAASAAAAEEGDGVVLQPGQSQLLQLTWRPVSAGALRCTLHLVYGDTQRVQVCQFFRHILSVIQLYWCRPDCSSHVVHAPGD